MHFMSKKTWFLLVAFLLLLPGCGKKSDLLADHGGSEEMCSSCTSVKKNEAQIASTDVTPLGVTPTNSGTYFSKYVSELSKKPLTPYEKIDAYKTADPKAPSVLDKPENKTQFPITFRNDRVFASDARDLGQGHSQAKKTETLSDYYANR